MTTLTANNKKVAAAVIIEDFYFECYKKGMNAEQAAAEAVKYEKELISRINGLVNEL